MDPAKGGALLNLAVCCVVVLWGSYLWAGPLRSKLNGDSRFLYRAFVFWWLSWLSWVGTWVVITFSVPANEDQQELLTLLASDLNAVFMLLVYFCVTRGKEFRVSSALKLSTRIVLPLGVSYAVMYLYFHDNFRFALGLHKNWSLCIGAVSTILLGWAFSLRFNASAVLVIGFVYGFSQPAAFQAVFNLDQGGESARSVLVVVRVALAFLKIIWATVVTRYLVHRPESVESLVREPALSPRHDFFQGWTKELTFQTVMLGAVYAFLLYGLVPVSIFDALAAITRLVLFCAIVFAVVWIVKWWTLRPDYYDVFLSYSHDDDNEANVLRDGITRAGGRAFVAPTTLHGGDKWADEIKGAISKSKELWVLVSPSSLKSRWVDIEVGAFWELGRKIVPILHGCSPSSLPQPMSERHSVEFSKHDELIEQTFGDH
jgi:hypothetical protein